jgi:hypothetical protein
MAAPGLRLSTGQACRAMTGGVDPSAKRLDTHVELYRTDGAPRCVSPRERQQKAADDEVCYGLPARERPPFTPPSRADEHAPFVP